MTVERVTVVFLLTTVTFLLGMYFGRISVVPDIKMTCAGHKYLQEDGTIKCEPKQQCPRGPKGVKL